MYVCLCKFAVGVFLRKEPVTKTNKKNIQAHEQMIRSDHLFRIEFPRLGFC